MKKENSTSKRLKGVVLAGVMAGALGVCAQEETIYLDTFGGSSRDNLNGREPDVSLNGAMWESWEPGVSWKADGSIKNAGGRPQNRAAFLPFVPESGAVYTLSLELIPGDSTDWFGLGFSSQKEMTVSFAVAESSVSPWMLLDSSRKFVQTCVGPGVQGKKRFFAKRGVWSVPATLKIMLSTVQEPWRVEWVINGNILRSEALPADLNIQYVGFMRQLYAAGKVNRFTLTVHR